MNGETREFGFSKSQGVDWSEYIKYRPLYPGSFFDRIFAYHAHKPDTNWSTAHDVGAGCGIVSSHLAARFNHVIVSDPNEGYTELAQKLLVQDTSTTDQSVSKVERDSKYTFFQQSAETPPPKTTASIDLITACEMLHFTDSAAALQSFATQLRPGGTLAISFYGPPRVVSDDARIRAAWASVWSEWMALLPRENETMDRVFRVVNTAYTSIALPEETWRDVERVYVNSSGNLTQWAMAGDKWITQSRVAEGEKIVWVECDEAWRGVKSVDWLKGHIGTYVPRVAEDALREQWDELEDAMGGKEVTIMYPVVIILATRR